MTDGTGTVDLGTVHSGGVPREHCKDRAAARKTAGKGEIGNGRIELRLCPRQQQGAERGSSAACHEGAGDIPEGHFSGQAVGQGF